MGEFIYAECRAHEALGVSASAMRKMRKELLKQDADWRIVPWNGRTIVAYKAQGLRRVVDALTDRSANVRPQDAEFERIMSICSIIDEPNQKTAPEESKALQTCRMPPVRMVVVKRPLNPKIIMCRMHEEDLLRLAAAMESRGIPNGLQRVRVHDSGKFIPRMVIGDCEHEQADLWNYRGKLPRYRGRL